MGTLPYCSPEILKDEPYNQKTDIWALGCILYEMCARKRAFDSESEEGLKQKILSFQIPMLPVLVPSMRDLNEIY